MISRTLLPNSRWKFKASTRRPLERTKAVAPHLQAGKTVYQTTHEFFGTQVKKPFMFYLKASEVALSKDFLDAPEFLIGALEKNGLFDKMERLLEV